MLGCDRQTDYAVSLVLVHFVRCLYCIHALYGISSHHLHTVCMQGAYKGIVYVVSTGNQAQCM